jgi:hypothetical protein
MKVLVTASQGAKADEPLYISDELKEDLDNIQQYLLLES